MRTFLATACGAFVAIFALRWPSRARFLYEFDSANYAFAIIDHNIFKHQPHPPGYPIWVWLSLAGTKLGFDANAAQIMLAITFAALGLAALIAFAREQFSASTVAIVVSAYVFAPGVALSCTTAMTYGVDLFTSAMGGWLAWRAWRGDRSAACWAMILLGLASGIRPSGAVLMSPLILRAVAMANGRALRPWLYSCGAAIVAGGAWFVPVTRLHGGAREYVRYITARENNPFFDTSVLYGAPASTHLAALRELAVWCAQDFAAIVAIALIAGRLSLAEAPRNDRPGRAFYMLWLAPEIILVVLLHVAKPGYLMIAIPPALLLFGAYIDRRLDGVRAVGSCAAVVAISSLLWVMPSSHQAVQRGTSSSIASSETDWAALFARFAVFPSDERLVVVDCSDTFGPNAKSIAFYERKTRLWEFANGKIHERGPHDVKPSSSRTLPREVSTILWVTCAEGVHGLLARQGFPKSAVSVRGEKIAIVETRVDDPAFTVIEYDGGIRIYAQPRAATSVRHEWGDGFGLIERDKDRQWIWAQGPRSKLLLHVTRDTAMGVSFHVGASPPSQVAKVSVNGQELAQFSDLPTGKTVSVSFSARPGTNVVELAFTRWNGHPETFAPNDGRALALSFDRVDLQLDGRVQTLIPQ
jgi:hypothetical protein